MDQSDALTSELGEVSMKWIFLETRSTSITQKQKAFKIQDFLTFDTIDEQIFKIFQQNSKFSEIFEKRKSKVVDNVTSGFLRIEMKSYFEISSR